MILKKLPKNSLNIRRFLLLVLSKICIMTWGFKENAFFAENWQIIGENCDHNSCSQF
jgi:hypothetical protein